MVKLFRFFFYKFDRQSFIIQRKCNGRICEKLELKDKISKKVKIDYKRSQLTYFIHNSDIIYLLVILIIIFSYLIIKKYIIYK